MWYSYYGFVWGFRDEMPESTDFFSKFVGNILGCGFGAGVDMDHRVKVLSAETLMAALPELLEAAETVPLLISGDSMAPFLRHGRDTVYLSKPRRPLKRGDMILYRRSGGAYVLHRICRVSDGVYTLIGDNQWDTEPGIRPDQVLALVTAVRRKGKLLRPGSFCWDFFGKVWIRVIPLRPFLCRTYGWLRGRKNGT